MFHVCRDVTYDVELSELEMLCKLPWRGATSDDRAKPAMGLLLGELRFLRDQPPSNQNNQPTN